MGKYLFSTTGSKYCGKFAEGDKFGNLTVVNNNIFCDKKSRAHVLCKCVCGERDYISCHHLLAGRSRNCKKCNYSMRKNVKNPNWKGSYCVPKTILTTLSSSAVLNNLEYSLDMQTVTKQLENQNFTCAYSGRMINPMNNTATLVRMDENKGYVNTNVVWVDKEIAKIKKFFDTDDDLIKLCKQVANNFEQRRKENE